MNHLALVLPGIDRIGGAERQVILLATGLRRRGWRVTVVALSGSGGDAAAELSAAGVEFLTLGMRKGLADPRGWLRFRRWLRSDPPAIVHAHLPHAAWFARWSRLLTPVRVLLDTVHTSSTGTAGRRLGYRFSGWLADRVTAVSHAVAESCLARSMVNPSRLTILPNGVDVEVFCPGAETRTSMRAEHHLDDQFVWLAAGRLDPVKDYPTLLRAMALLPEPSMLVIAGGGPLQDQLRALVKELGVERRVRFLGFERDVQRWMRAADGFVLSSLWEGLPMGLLEACACGLPVVATDVPGTREVVLHGQTGALTPARDPASLSRAMTAIMRVSTADRAGMGIAARERVIALYSVHTVLDRWEALYEDMLRRNPAPQRRHRSS